MDRWQPYLLVAGGGAAGALARFAVGAWCARTLGTRFPWGTMVVNLTGCFAIGLVLTLVEERWLARETLRPLIVIGFLGAYTTFSAFGWESHTLIADAEWLRAAASVLGSVAVGLLAVRLGVLLARCGGG